MIFRLIKSSSLIAMLAVHSIAVNFNDGSKAFSKQFPAKIATQSKKISKNTSKDKRIMIPEAVWKLSGIPKPYINDKFQNLYDTYDW